MATIALGDTTIQPIVEMMERTIFKADTFFPTMDRAAFDRHLPWMEGQCYDGETKRIFLSIHSWLVRTPHHTILIDTCIGNDKDREGMDSWSGMQTPWLEKLAAAGVAPEDVDYVMCTHLHVDHVGWNTSLADGRWTPTFPNAKYLFCRQEYDYCENREGDAFSRRVYLDSILPVVEAGQAVMIEDGYTLDDCFEIELAPGHTPGSIVIGLEDGGKRGRFTGDVIHHPVQVYHPDWSSRACIDPAQSAATRRRVLADVAESGALLLPAHFPNPHAGHVTAQGDAFAFHWLVGE